MNPLKKLLLCSLIVGLCMTISCKDDKEEAIPNEFVYNSVSYGITGAYLQDYGSNGNGSFDLDIILTSETLALNSQGLASGAGHVFYLDLNAGSETLTSGTYTWNNERIANSIVAGGFAVFEEGADSLSGEVNATGGTVTLTVSGTNYTLKFDLNMQGGKTAKGTYSGTITEVGS